MIASSRWEYPIVQLPVVYSTVATMTPLDLHDYYDDNGNTPDFTELARIASIESEDNKSKSYPVLSFCLAQTYHSPGFDTPPATRPGEMY